MICSHIKHLKNRWHEECPGETLARSEEIYSLKKKKTVSQLKKKKVRYNTLNKKSRDWPLLLPRANHEKLQIVHRNTYGMYTRYTHYEAGAEM